MITATGMELRAGARILLEPTSFRVGLGDRIGLVGRNGAGKTTTLRVLAGEGVPYGGQVVRSGPLGYLPQDPREGDLSISAKDRASPPIFSASTVVMAAVSVVLPWSI